MRVNKSRPSGLETGRVNQKLRTRDLLVSVAAELIREGRRFSVGDVADLAQVGRTTAYRYFPTHEAILAHAALWKLAHLEHSEFNHVFDRGSIFETIDALVSASDKSTHDYEHEYRAMLRVSLDRTAESQSTLPRRTSFRTQSLTQALKTVAVKLGAERTERLVGALSLSMGIEALVVTRDVCLFDPKRAREIKRWAARALLKTAFAEAGVELDPDQSVTGDKATTQRATALSQMPESRNDAPGKASRAKQRKRTSQSTQRYNRK